MIDDPNADILYGDSFCRNRGIISEQEQHTLRASRIAVAGTGGVGGVYLATLARVGVGHFVISDPDTFDYSNLNRQYGATIETVGQNKAEVMRRVVLSINPSAEVTIIEGGLRYGNIGSLLDGCDLVLDCLDAYCINEVIQLHRVARAMNLFAFKGVPIGFGASLMVFDPQGMSFDEYFGIDEVWDGEAMGEGASPEQVRKLFSSWIDGFAPSKLHERYLDPTVYSPFDEQGAFLEKPLPSLCTAVNLCAGLVTTEAVLFLLGRRPPLAVPEVLEIDQLSLGFRLSDGAEGGRDGR